MSEVKRYHLEAFIDNYYKHYQFILASDYDALAAEAQALREEVAALRARVVVPDRRDPLNSTGDDENPRYAGFNECLDELARLNGMTVSEGLLRRLLDSDGIDGIFDAQQNYAAHQELRALLSEQE
ncbi:TPA: hypothetical protein ACQGQ1_000969 [Pseudomonas aeruginosa]